MAFLETEYNLKLLVLSDQLSKNKDKYPETKKNVINNPWTIRIAVNKFSVY